MQLLRNILSSRRPSAEKQEYTYDFSQHQDTLFTGVFHRVYNCSSRYMVVYGSAMSGKSYSVHQSELLQLMQEGHGDTLFLRKYASQHRESCFKLLVGLIYQYNLQHLFRCCFSGDNRRITYLPNGRSFIFRGVDNPEKLKSIVNIRRVVMEEASEFALNDFTEVVRRARGFADTQFILVLNPVSENHWIKKQVCDEQSVYHSSASVMQFTYRDNCDATGRLFITEQDMAGLEALAQLDENQHRVYALGQWGVDDKTRKFVWAFDPALHLKPTIYDRENILWASFDFNVNPLTCTLFQYSCRDYSIKAIECFRLPNSDIWKMCERLKASYPRAQWKITGDATGASRSALSQDNLNYFQIIIREMNLSLMRLQVPTSNPPVESNQLLVNAAFKRWTVTIDPERCKPLIEDITYVEMDAQKRIIKDRSNAHRCADFLDTLRYFVNAVIRPVMPEHWVNC